MVVIPVDVATSKESHLPSTFLLVVVAGRRYPTGLENKINKTINGNPFQWCKACGHWSTTHGTFTHQGFASKSKETSSSNQGDSRSKSGYNFWLIPSAWIT
jgi:hypothetical protein